MTEHTPGPWTFEERHDSACGDPYCTQDGCPNDHPSGVYDIDGPSAVDDFGEDSVLTVRDIKDARLIAAAPDLVTALLALRASPLESSSQPKHGLIVRFTADTMRSVAAALAAAKGTA